MATLLEAALDAERRGYSVVPIHPRSKRPAVAWKVLQQRLATPEHIKRWYAKVPDLNVGVVTGPISGLMVADLDPRNDATGETTAWLAKLMPAPTVITPNGWHWHMPDVGLPSLPRLLPGLDLKSAGGFVLVPPSVHPNERLYERLTDRLVEMPGELMQLAIDRLGRTTQRTTSTGQLYLACCPAHDDQHPSLSLAESPTGRLLAKCLAGCTFTSRSCGRSGRGDGIGSSQS
jgi:hypothetical protein